MTGRNSGPRETSRGRGPLPVRVVGRGGPPGPGGTPQIPRPLGPGPSDRGTASEAGPALGTVENNPFTRQGNGALGREGLLARPGRRHGQSQATRCCSPRFEPARLIPTGHLYLFFFFLDQRGRQHQNGNGQRLFRYIVKRHHRRRDRLFYRAGTPGVFQRGQDAPETPCFRHAHSAATLAPVLSVPGKAGNRPAQGDCRGRHEAPKPRRGGTGSFSRVEGPRASPATGGAQLQARGAGVRFRNQTWLTGPVGRGSQIIATDDPSAKTGGF